MANALAKQIVPRQQFDYAVSRRARPGAPFRSNRKQMEVGDHLRDVESHRALHLKPLVVCYACALTNDW
jgi:hypothetical protein